MRYNNKYRRILYVLKDSESILWYIILIKRIHITRYSRNILPFRNLRITNNNNIYSYNQTIGVSYLAHITFLVDFIHPCIYVEPKHTYYSRCCLPDKIKQVFCDAIYEYRAKRGVVNKQLVCS